MSEEFTMEDAFGGFDPMGLRSPAQVEATGSSPPEQTAPEQTAQDSGASGIQMGEPDADPAAAVDPNAAPAPAPAPAAPDPQAARDALLAQQSQAIQHMLAQQQVAAQQQAPGQTAPPPPMFSVSVPPAVTEAIFSGDATMAAQGLNALINMTMNTTAERVMAAMQQKMEGEYFQRITGHMQTAQQQQQTIAQTETMFYSVNPHLKTPVGRQVAAAVTQQMMMEDRMQFAKGLTPELVAQIAKRADDHLASMGYVRQQPAQRPPAGFVAGNGARPPAQPQSLLADMVNEFAPN